MYSKVTYLSLSLRICLKRNIKPLNEDELKERLKIYLFFEKFLFYLFFYLIILLLFKNTLKTLPEMRKKTIQLSTISNYRSNEKKLKVKIN